MYDFSILRDLRKRSGLNIADVSARSGVSAAVISKLERNPKLDTETFRFTPPKGADVLTE